MIRPFALAVVAAISLAAATLPVSARAQTLKENEQHCQDSDPKVSISGCTALIQSPQQSTDILAIAYFGRGNAYNETGQYDLAIADYSQAIQLNPNYVEAFDNRGQTYYDKAQYDLAIADYNQAIRIKPDFADAYTNRGVAYVGEGQLDLAIADYNTAIRLQPNNATELEDRGLAYSSKGQFNLTMADFNAAISLEPNDAQGFYDRGLAYTDQGQYDLGIADFNTAIRLSPNDAEAFQSRSLAYEGKGQLDLAIADNTTAISLRPSYAQAYDSRCDDRAMLGQLDQALADCNQSLSLNSKDELALENRGFTYLKMGKLDLAIADYNSALAINSKSADSLYGRGLAEEKSNAAASASDVAAALAIDSQVATNFSSWGVKLAPPANPPANAPASPQANTSASTSAGAPTDASITATLSGEIFLALAKLPAYQAITGLYDQNKGNAAWLKSAQGLTAMKLLQQIRSDAAAISLEGSKDDAMVDYSVGGVKVSDANIRAVDLEGDPSYRAQIADLIAQTITQQPPVTKFLSTLSPPAPPPPATPPASPAPAAPPIPPPLGADFYYAGSSDTDHMSIIDPTTISASQNGLKTFHVAEISEFNLWNDLTMEVDCGSRRWQLISIVSHLAGGDTLDMTSQNPNIHVWETPNAGSDGAHIQELVCRYPDKKPTGKSVFHFPNFQSALEAVSEVITNDQKGK